uniref:Fibrinogen C-terminal domain-containing protein n=1 Tax=Plectus sambesii TaxID=2011161 RepID=A0A914UXB2_9BILA
METAGGGWTIIQRRVDDSLMFLNKTRKEYKDGFNVQSTSWLGWLGLENVHILSTKDDNVTLRIDLWTFDQTYLWGEWPVRIDGEGSRYKLNVGEMLAGNLDETENGTFRANHNLGQFFTASDGDNCASLQKNNKKYGPFWYAAPGARPAPKECGSAHLNGAYHTTQMSSDEGCGWMLSNQRWINPVRSEMKLRKNVPN